MKRAITQNLLNIPGWRTNRKIVVIESDDWGSIRMPSKNVYDKLKRQGYPVDDCPYMKFDALASNNDLHAMYEVLTRYIDKNGKHPVITANAVMANPNFASIEKEQYQEYHYELFTETLKQYTSHDNAFDLWKEGIGVKIFHPQFHGREHLNVDQWLKGLQRGEKHQLRAFKNRMISITGVNEGTRFDFMEALDYYTESEYEHKATILQEGMDLFEKQFGYRSKSFIANCYIWNQKNEDALQSKGVEYIQGIPNQIQPKLNNKGHSYLYKKHYLGERNANEQRYLIRNAHFEPSQQPGADVVSECLRRIGIAFRWNKPAIISAHRLNFIGYIDERNRHDNLKMLDTLLKNILKQWPGVEFMTSDQLGDLIKYGERN
ncbi:hypothetical protein EYV94_08200 [Puteibacter caeruleilacunae]|nr:hypothetical protein EYV94_08200 [Puteibacter caeruleilacunae]